MTGRGASDDDEQQERGRGSARLPLVAALALALGAAAVLVLSDNARWLRLAVVAALWAALVGAFLAARYRRQVADREDEVADLQSVYELELEREVAARREYELEIESETRKRVQEEAKDDLEALRNELRTLRENLEALLGGEVLVERVALRAESTRMRSLSDQSRLMAVGDKRIITTGTSGPVVKKAAEPQVDRTELIERVAHDTPRKDQVRRPEPTRPEPARREQAQPVRREPARAAAQPRPTPPVVVRREAPKVEPTDRVNRADVPPRPGPPRPTEPVERPAAARPPEPSKSEHTTQRRSRVAERTEMISRDALGPQAAPQNSPSQPERRAEQAGGAGQARRPSAPGRPAVESTGERRVGVTGEQRAAPGGTGEQRAVPRGATGEQRVVQPEARRPSTARAELTGEYRPVSGGGRTEGTGQYRPVPGGGKAGSNGERRPASGGGPVEGTGQYRPVSGGGRAEANGGPVSGAGRANANGEHRPAEPARRAPVEGDARRSRRTASEMTGGHSPVVGESQVGRPAAAAPASAAPSEGRRRAPEPAAETGGRRRAEEQWDSWEDTPPSGRRSAPEPAPPPGAHADGKSVSELLASLGGADSPRRRRRRED